jgi:outer membrane protein OmpA-like peptidoglycan-associated protein
MKKILAIILVVTPFLLIGQVKGNYTLRVNYGMVFDENHSDLDVDEHSPDLYSKYNNRDDVKKAFKLSGGYYFKDNFLIGLSYMNSDIAGSNDIEFWDGEFSETSLFVEYEFFKKYGFGIYATGGVGRIDFDAFRSLMLDDGQVPLNSYSGSSIKYQYGGGITYVVNDLIKLNLEVSRNIVKDDGFDGWDYGSGEDRFLYKSIGISFLFGTGDNNKTQELKEVIEAPVVIEDAVKIAEDPIEDTIEKPIKDVIEVAEELIAIVVEKPIEKIIIQEPVEYNFTIFFDSDSDVLVDLSKNTISEIYKLLSSHTGYTVVLVGYADADGTEPYNLVLSEKRTTKVFNKLVDSGISADKFNIIFHGESYPLDDNSTEEGKKNNRVVTVQFTIKNN